MNFMTGFHHKGTLVMEPSRCAWKSAACQSNCCANCAVRVSWHVMHAHVSYFRTWFIIDLLGIFPWRYITPGEQKAGAAKLL
eukprot:6436741-Amphidinium_carterae.1